MFFFFFFKQKTAYEMRISDWSSDVCSSDLDNCLRCANVQLDAPDSAMRRGNFTVPNVHSAFKSNFSYKLRPFQRGGIQNENAMRKIIWTGLAALTIAVPTSAMRSEEHTSELQSLMRISYAGFCLNKKKIQYNTSNTCRHNI